MTKIRELHEKWVKDAEYRKEYEALEEEFARAASKAQRRGQISLATEGQAKAKP
jgi:hypothetical protein